MSQALRPLLSQGLLLFHDLVTTSRSFDSVTLSSDINVSFAYSDRFNLPGRFFRLSSSRGPLPYGGR